jgi:hypothetical protein
MVVLLDSQNNQVGNLAGILPAFKGLYWRLHNQEAKVSAIF